MERNLLNFDVAVVFDDHQLFSTSFSMLLERMGIFSAVYTFTSETDVRSFFIQTTFRHVCFFLDYYIPGCNSLFLVSDIRRYCPGTRIVIVTSVTNPVVLKQALLYKVDGFISKIDDADEVVNGLRAISAQKVFFSRTITCILETEPDTNIAFSPRELEVLKCFSNTHTVEQIADRLNISKHTVLTHKKNLLAKSGFHTVRELVAYGLKSGLITSD
ncbi:two component transcriptional regulator, LuxR family [Dyadobacter sp. SG02]|uniref:DNA-binding response regulator n=1 Tax=Dyadobacter sp. SG02 TaxID=1855291 RepID=UPI0008BF4511|nr:response regulator transcription factor [Dyadobacter sp. SG02]SEJ38040.1 two component transcriptional regulator, LuxR family [Dyadobacter sp. SG02]